MRDPAPVDYERKLDVLVRLVAGGKVTVLSGAGLSTASGLPDFRGREGLWTEGDLGTLLTADGARERFDEFTRFCKTALGTVMAHRPNAGHAAIARLAQAGLVQHVITQNVDGYDVELGVDAIEVHGSLRRISCSTCGTKVLETIYLAPAGDVCACGGRRRPGIVLFGEALPPGVLPAAFEAIAVTRLLLVVGTTMAVAPITLAAPLVVDNCGQVAVINDGATEHDDLALVTLRHDITKVLSDLADRVAGGRDAS